MSSSKKTEGNVDDAERADTTRRNGRSAESQEDAPGSGDAPCPPGAGALPEVRAPVPRANRGVTRRRIPRAEFGGSTDAVDEELLNQLRQLSRGSSTAPAPADSDPGEDRDSADPDPTNSDPTAPDPTDPDPAAPSARVEFPGQPVIEELGEWANAGTGEPSIDLDLESLPERTPLSPPRQSASRLPAVPVPEPEIYPVVAIDFGTSYSSVAVLKGDLPVLLPRPMGCIPSMVGVREDGFTVVGEEARQMRVADPANVIAAPKRLLGRQFLDRELDAYLANLGMSSTEGQGGEVLLHARGQIYSVEQLCATVLYRLRQHAQDYIGGPVTEAVFTVPVSFGNNRIAALIRAAGIAGLRTVKVLEEPAAAALAYHEAVSLRGLIAVYDFGGGTFDFSVLDADRGLAVVATAGDTWLGGDDLDEALAGAVANAFWRQSKIELRNTVVQWQRLLWAAERTKRQLSTATEARLVLNQVARTKKGSLNLDVEITREQLSVLVGGLIERSLDTCEQTLDLCDVDPSKISAVFLSGGTSLVPAVREGVQRFFGTTPTVSVPPDWAVILGAASYVNLLRQEKEAPT